jgi:hypothetical protein
LPSTPFQVPGFGTLNLRDDPATVGVAQATDALNVSLSVPGRIATRGGYTKLNTTTPAGTYTNVVETRAGGTAHLVAFRGTNLDSISGGGVVTAAAATFAAFFAPFQTTEFGSPSGTLLYIADSNLNGGANTLQKWNGATLANSSGKPQFVAVTPWSNRLVQARYAAAADTPSGANGSDSTVVFSDAGAPDTYTSTSWLQLHPGDGEGITSIVAWHELLFVFKETAVFVFYGEATRADGTPEFLYHRITLPSPIVIFANTHTSTVYAATAGPDGVYYHAADGIYRTAGGTPQEISSVVRGIFSGSAASSQTRSGSSGTAFGFHLSAISERVYLSYVNGDGNHRILVFDRPSGTWTIWNIPAVASTMPIFGAGFRSNSRSRTPYFIDDATTDIYQYSESATTDNGSAISWSYTSGFDALGSPGQAKVVGESAMWGTGTVTLQVASDFAAVDTGSAVTLGTSPAIARGWQQIDREGTYLQHKLSGSGVAMVNRLIHHVELLKTSGVE